MEFSSSGGMRSPFSPRVRQSITGRKPLGGSRQNQGNYTDSPESQNGEVIYKTASATVETFGPPLPVMVTEMLTFGPAAVSARVSPSGWAWAVGGRRAVVWARGGPARHLPLPQTDLAHKADLLDIFFVDGAQMPSCVSVSPEGVVRYWPSAGHEAASADAGCGLAGQEADRLVAAGRRLLLATTEGALLILYPAVSQGRMTVASRVLRPPSGWLGGIGRRVSNLFFGAVPPATDTKLVTVVVVKEGALEPGAAEEEGEPEGCAVVLGSGGAGAPLLTVWGSGGAGAAAAGGAPRQAEHCLRRALADPRHGDLGVCELTALDAAAVPGTEDTLLVLISAAARDQPPRHFIVKVTVGGGSLRVVSVTGARWAGGAARLLALPGGGGAMLYCGAGSRLMLLPVGAGAGAGGAVEGDVLDLAAAGDRLLGAALAGPGVLLLTRAHGPLALRPHAAPSMCDSPMGSPCPSDLYDGNLSFYEIDPNELNVAPGDAAGQLRLAVLLHARGATAAARSTLLAAFPPAAAPAAAEPARDRPLDRAARQVAAALLDDPPAGDPRWKCGSAGAGGASGVALGSSTGLQHAAQLADKQRALLVLRDVLRPLGLQAVTAEYCAEGEAGGGGQAVPTAWELAELAARLAGARALRPLLDSSPHLLRRAVALVVSGDHAPWEEEPSVEEAMASGALSAADVCFRRVTRVPRLLRAVAVCATDGPPAAAAAGAALLAHVLGEMSAARAGWAAGAPALGLRPLVPPLLRLLRRTLECAGAEASEASEAAAAARWRAADAARALADRVLADLAEGAAFIRPFVEEAFTEHALALAEKFKEFPLLVELCVAAGDLDKLYDYVDQYGDQGVADAAFAAVFAAGGRAAGATLRCGRPGVARALRRWLRAGPRRRRAPLRALHALCALCAGGARAAAAHLAALAADERRSATRMTTMASLGKLCLLASDGAESEDNGELDGEGEGEGEREGAGAESEREVRSLLSRSLLLADQLAALPRQLKLHHGLDSDDMRVLDPEELLQMYVEWEDVPSELELKKALDLAPLLPPGHRHQARLQVWAASVAQDQWAEADVAHPEQVIGGTMFCRLLELVLLMGDDVEVVVPPLAEILTQPRVAHLAREPRALFLLKYGAQALLGRGRDQHWDCDG